MSSEFDQYFQDFLGDDSHDFDIFGDDFNGEPEGLHHSSDFPSSPPPTFDTAIGETLLPDTDARASGVPNYPSVNPESPRIASPSLCSWISCSTRSALRTEAEMTVHHEDHWQKTLQQWLGPQGCIWEDCSSRATFKSPSALKTHVFNIHINPLVCTYSQCTYPKPFGKQYDLRRHIATAHAASASHVCPVESCDANTNGFARKDKLLNHIREQHDSLRCPYSHCHATILSTEQEAHIQHAHGPFECALGACEKEPASCFSEVRLGRHFRKDHNMAYDPTVSTTNKAKQTMDKTARSSHIAKLKKWKDCPSCSDA